MNYAMTINRGAAALRAWMEKRGCSQAQIAILVGASQQNVSKWLNGGYISLASAMAIQRVTDIPAGEWLEAVEAKRLARSA